MKKRVLFLLLSLSFSGIWFSSCDTTPTSDTAKKTTADTTTANQKTTQAYIEMIINCLPRTDFNRTANTVSTFGSSINS